MLLNPLLKSHFKFQLLLLLSQFIFKEYLVQIFEVALQVLVLLAEQQQYRVYDEEHAHISDDVGEPDEVDHDPRQTCQSRPVFYVRPR